MSIGAANLQVQSQLQSYNLSGRINMESYQYTRLEKKGPNGSSDVVELGQGQKISIEFSISILQQRTQQKIADALPQSPDASGLPSPEQGIDISPQATADRITQFATSFLGAYKQQHPELGDKEAADQYMDLIKGAIDEGFSQARKIIDAMSAMTPELDNTVNQTYDLVQKNLDDFYNSLLEQIQSNNAPDAQLLAA